jgi:hypothetical protein
MTASSDIRRRPDGSIDFDHYRHAAARERQQTLRQTFGRLAAVARRAAAMLAERSARTSSRPGSLAR